MSFERPLPGAGMGAEPAIAPGPVERSTSGTADGGIPPALRLQILATEHWSLLASRSLAWNESFSRAGMFLATLSGAIVALALVAQASDFGDGFRIFGLAILPVVLLVGLGTAFRLGFSNYHDAMTVTGMNRIRAAYLEIDPDVGQYFVTGTSDDDASIEATMGIPPGTPIVVQMFASTPLLVTVLDGVVAGAIAALLALQLGASVGVAIAAGLVAGLVLLAAFTVYATRQIRSAGEQFRPRFPADAP